MSELPGWLEPLYTADEMRALDAWAIHDEGVPSLELMERAGAEVARVVTAMAPTGPSASCAARATTAGTASWSHGCCAARPRGRGAAARRSRGPSADARANFDRLADTGAVARDRRGRPARRARGIGAIVDALLGTGFEGAPRAPLDAAIDAVNVRGAGDRGRRPLGCERGHRRGRGRVRARRRDRHLPRRQGRPVGGPGQVAAGRVEVVPSASRPTWGGAPEPRTAGLIRAAGAGTLAPRGPGPRSSPPARCWSWEARPASPERSASPARGRCAPAPDGCAPGSRNPSTRCSR